MATHHNFRIKNGLEVGGVLIVNSSGQLQAASISGAISATSIGVTNIVTNKVVKFNGTILDDSNITDTGSLITLGSNTAVTGKIQLNDGADIQWAGGYGSNKPLIAANTNVLNFYTHGASGGVEFALTGSAVDFKNNPATNVGTISSGAITSSGSLTLSSNSISVNTRSVLARDTNGLNIGTTNATTAISIDNSANVTMGYNLTVTGNLIVNGTTVTLNTATLDVEDKNITLNYGAGDTSGSADGAGITIQDAVNSTTNATILWDKSNSRFTTSHALNVGGTLVAGAVNATGDITINSTTDDKLRLYVNSSDGNDWNYISYYGRDGTRDSYIGTDSDGDLNLYSDKNGNLIQLAASGINFSGKPLRMTGTEFLDTSRNLTVGTIDSGAITATAGLFDNGTSTLLNVRCDDGGNAIVRAGGQGQGTGAFEVSQDDGSHGGGMSYNGDGSPAFVSGETADHITFYRINSGTRSEVFHYAYNADTVTFNGNISVSGTVDGVDIAARDGVLTSTTTTAGAALPKAGGTMTGLLTINHTNDNQILLTSPSSWTGIGFNDSGSNGTQYIWHNGTHGTFAIGGGGSNVANKKLHVDGGMTIGSSYDATAIDANSLKVEGTIHSSTIDIRDAAGTGTRYLHVPRSGGVTLYGDGSSNHSISSRGRAFTAADDLRINSYGSLFINLDSNSNNSADADFVIGRHGGISAMATSQDLLIVNGENGNVNIAYDNAALTFGSAGTNGVAGCWASMEGNTDTSGEGSGRLFFREHNSTTAGADNYGMSLGYRGGSTALTTAMGNSWDGLGQIGNGQWGMWGHDGSNSGALIMYGDRAATFVDFASNNIQGITDAYIADQIIHTGDTDTYLQFNAENTFRIVAGGVERLRVDGDVKIQGTTDLSITGTSRRLNFTAGTGTIRTTTGNSLILGANSGTGITIDSSNDTAIAGSLKVEASASTAAAVKLQVGTINNAGSSAIAQFGGFLRASEYYILHETTGSSNSLFIDYVGNDMDIRAGEGSYTGALRANSYKVGTTTRINSVGDIIGTSYYVGSTNIVDTSRNLFVATGASSGKFAVMSSSVHGSYDFYNNGTTYLNGGTIIDASLTVSGSSAVVKVGPKFYEDYEISGHFYLGNNDWSSLIGGSGNGYSATHKGMSFNNESGIIPCLIPIDPEATYRVKIRFKQVTVSSGTGKFYFGVHTLNEDKSGLSSDTATSYNYGVVIGQGHSAGTVYTYEDTFSGYNATNAGDHQKFDPEGKYFNLIWIANYQGSGEVVIQSIEVERLPGSLWIGDTQVIDASRNISDIGTISSGNITAPKYYLANSAYGVGIVNGSSARFDTVDSGSSTDPLELCYYNGNGVRIGPNGGDQYLSAGSIQITGTSVIDSSRQIFATNATFDNGTSTTVSVKCDDGGTALIRANGDAQGTGAIEVGQSNDYGGGMSYNGDGSPGWAAGETPDHITFYRMSNGTRTEVFHYPYSANDVTFNGSIIGNSSSTTEIGTYPTGAIKRIRMTQGGELHFGDTTTTNFLGITEGAVNNFSDQDRLGIYFRNEMKFYSNSNALRHTFDVSGNYTAVGNVTAYSDIRLKDDLQPIEDAVSKVQKLKGVTYFRNDNDDENRQAGLIAQDVELVLPEAVRETEDGIKSVNYNATIALLVESIKEQQTLINRLEKRINTLENNGE